jgi:hypothetical protein
LLEAKIAQAAATATLKARDKAAAGEAKLREELAAARIENGRLQAQLDVAAEKAELAAELRQARLELAALKAHSESLVRPDRDPPAAETARRPIR